MERFACLDLARATRTESANSGVVLSQGLSSRLGWYQIGSRELLGLPFLICPDPSDGTAGVKMGAGEDSRLKIEIGARARWLIIIHDADQGCGGYTEPVARYVVHREGAPDIEKVVRYGIEIPAFEQPLHNFGTFNAALPLRATPTDSWFTRETGLQLGMAPSPASYRLYVWENPEPDIPITSLECVNTGSKPIVLSAITLCNEIEHPVRIIPRTTLAIDFSGIENLALSDVQVTIDRGMVVRVEPLEPVAADFLTTPDAGWGIRAAAEKRSLRAEVFGPHGATIGIRMGKGPQASVEFGQALDAGDVSLADGKIRVQVMHPEKTWIHAQVVDAGTGRTVPARVHFRGEKGEYIPPAGHHRDVNTGTNEMYGTDVRVNGTNYAYVDGTFQIDMPVGRVYAEVARGFEYRPVRTELEIRPGQRELTLKLERFLDMRGKGFYSADTHVHFVTTQGGLLEAGAEDLAVLNILATQLGKLYTSFSQFSGAPSNVSTDDHIVYVSLENRQHVLGHINLLGVKRPIFPICTSGPPEAWLGDALEATVGDWADETHRQGGIVVQPHFGAIFNEYIPNALMGKLDATEIAPWTFLSRDFFLMAFQNWYRVLNCGVKMPVVGGTDKMTDAAAVGGCRTYAHIAGGEKLTYHAWCDAIRAGNTFTTTGPMLFLSAEGMPVGSTVRLSGNGGSVEVEATATGYFPIKVIELIACGEVVATVTPEGPAECKAGIANLSGGRVSSSDDCTVVLRARVPMPRSGWVAVRCWGREDIPGPRGMVAAHTSPIYFEVGKQKPFSPSDATYMVQVLDEMLAWANEVAVYRTPQKKLDMVGIFATAKKMLHDRLHEHGAAHGHE